MPKGKQPVKTFSTDWRQQEASGRALATFEERFAKKYGMPVTTRDRPYEVLPTGSLSLDFALGIGGLATGRVHEMWGPEHAGKTTLAVLMALQAQRRYPKQRVAWVDMEQTFDEEWADRLGLDVDAVWRPPVRTAEDTADLTKDFALSGMCSLVVLDSVGGMIARMEIEKGADESTVGRVPKIVTEMVKACSPIARANNTTLMVINQVRAVIGGYGASQSTGGGWALKHITTSKLKVGRGEGKLTVTRDGKEEPVGHEIAVKVEKNKVYPYGKVASLWLRNQDSDRHGPVGVDQVDEAVVFGKRLGIFGVRGSWLDLPDGTSHNGATAAKEHLREHPDLLEQVRQRVVATLSEQVRDESEAESEDPLNMAEVLGG